MNLSVSARYAVRSLLRQRRRTLLSVLGVGIGCMSCLVTIAWIRGEGDLIVRSAAETGAGHLRIAPKGWASLRESDLRIDRWRDELARARAMEGVAVATPRARANALLAAGTRVAAVEIVGVDPATEQASNRLVRNVTQGRFLAPGDAGSTEVAVVIGEAIAKRLGVGLDDLLMLTMSDAGGEMRAAMLVVVGRVSTGSKEMDSTICEVPLGDLARLTGRDGAGEIAILLEDHRRLDDFARRVRADLAGDNDVLTWADVAPELRDGVKIDEGFTNATVGIVVILVLLGITSAQLTAVLERRREFAVLSALGMKGSEMLRLVLAEGLVLGLAGAAAGLLLALAPVYLLSTYGVDMRWFVEDMDLAMSSFLLEPVLHADMGLWLVPYALAVSLVSTILASIYPAWFAIRTDAASALRVD